MQNNAAPLILDIAGRSLTEEDRELLAHPNVGGLILFSRNYTEPEQLKSLLAEIREVNSELLISVDHEGGRVQRFRNGFSAIPPMQKLGELFARYPERAKKNAWLMGWLMAAELLQMGVDISFAPVLDLDDSFSDVIGDRSFSTNANVVAELAGEFIRGMNAAGMRATGKHFPGHGGVKEDSHLELPVDKRSLLTLQGHDLIPFSRLLPELAGIMPAHVVFPAVDELPVGFSSRWIKDILRKQMGFSGIVFSDDLSMEGAASVGNYAARARAAFEAGCDAVLVCNNRDATLEVLEYIEKNIHAFSCRDLRTMRGTRLKNFPEDITSLNEYVSAREALETIS